MERLLYIVLVFFPACIQSDDQGDKGGLSNNAGPVAELMLTTFDTLDVKENIEDLGPLNSLGIFRDFALNYAPTSRPNSGIARLPETTDTIVIAMRTLQFEQPGEFEKYLTLLFVKLYNAHLECCHQAYEVRSRPSIGIDKEKDPLVHAFNQLTKMYPENKAVEFIPSHLGHEYVKANIHLLEFEPIKKHVEKIEQVHKNIDEGLYWN